MAFENYRDASRKNWGDDESKSNLSTIQTGAILRIADATEKMAQRHTELINDRDYWERRAKRAEATLDTERRRIAALRGHLKKIKAQRSAE